MIELWTEAQRSYEFHVTYETRLGIRCEDRDSTPEQRKIAWDEAVEHMQKSDPKAEQPSLL